jgi:hypothetical protein
VTTPASTPAPDFVPAVGDRVIYARGGATAYLGRTGTVVEPKRQSLPSGLREVYFPEKGLNAVVAADGLDPAPESAGS